MATVADILNYLNTIAPPYMKEEWDHIGLNCGRMDSPVEKVLIALDPFAAACQEAADWGAQLLVTHHALIWDAGFITDQDEQGRNVLFLLEHGIAHINAHTNLDLAPGGVNDVLAATLGLENIQVLNPAGADEDGNPYGLLHVGTVREQSPEEFLTTVKEKLGCPGLRYADGGKIVRKVAVGGGSCGNGLYEVAAAGCDTFVTADVKYNQFWDAKNLGLTIIDAGHFYTENPVCAVLAAKIAAAFPEISVNISQNHRDCMKFF